MRSIPYCQVEEAIAAADAHEEMAQEAEALAVQRSSRLVAETVALAVASGWAWNNAMTVTMPFLAASSALTRGIGAACVTASAAFALLALKPPSGAESVGAGEYQPPTHPMDVGSE